MKHTNVAPTSYQAGFIVCLGEIRTNSLLNAAHI